MLNYYILGFKKLFSIFKKFFLVIAVYFIVINLFFYFINKDRPKTTTDLLKKNREEIYKMINDKELNSIEEGKLAITFYRSLLCLTIGEACTDNPADGDKNFNHSIFGFITNLIVLPYANPPASGVYWAYSGLQNTGFIPKTYAAEGIGFAAIKPFMSVWKVFRDISYMILVLVLIAIGFMIMFRAKLNAQTVVSVENSLPKIVIALLLITFSFPIAGFLIDLMYVSIGIIAVFFSNITNAPQEFNTPQKIIDVFYFEKDKNLSGLIFWDNVNPFGNLGGLAASIFGLLPDSLQFLINSILLFIFPPHFVLGLLLSIKGSKFADENLKYLKSRIPAAAADLWLRKYGIIKENSDNAGSGTPILSVIVGLFFLIIEILLSQIVGDLVAIALLWIILALSLIYLFFRIFFVLLYAYIQVILLIFFAPVILMAEMIPGKSTFSSWVKNLIVNLLTWPILTVLLLINKILMSQNLEASTFWQPPFLLSLNSKHIATVISMGILFMVPDLIKLLKELLGVKPLPLGMNLGTFTAGTGAIIGGAAGAASQFYTPYSFLFSQHGILRGLFKIPDIRKTANDVGDATSGSKGAGPGTTPPQK